MTLQRHQASTKLAVKAVEEMILEGPQSSVVHWDLQAPGEDGYEECHGVGQVL